jgi:hypothetical protein
MENKLLNDDYTDLKVISLLVGEYDYYIIFIGYAKLLKLSDHIIF